MPNLNPSHEHIIDPAHAEIEAILSSYAEKNPLTRFCAYVEDGKLRPEKVTEPGLDGVITDQYAKDLHLKSDLRRVITHLGLSCFYYLSQEPLGILGPGNEITVINLVVSQFILGEIALYSFVIYSLYLHKSTSFPPGTIRMNLL